MGVSRILLVVGVLGIAGGIVWFVVRDRTTEPRSIPAGSAADVGKAAIAAPEGPSLATGTASTPTADAVAVTPPSAGGAAGSASAAAVPEVPTGSSPKVAFASQARDPTWAGPTETEISKRLGALKAPLDRVECRHDRCELTLAGDADAVSAAMASLESPKGLVGYAASWLLTAPETQNGRMTLRVYATFAR
jgi:hypothetical protein